MSHSRGHQWCIIQVPDLQRGLFWWVPQVQLLPWGLHLHCKYSSHKTFSKLLGYGVILGAVVVKVPQIVSILVAGNVDGISPSMYYFEIISLVIQIAYCIHTKSPFSVWGDSIFLLLQGLVILLMIWKMNKEISAVTKLGFTTLIAGLVTYLFFFDVPLNIWDLLVGNVVLINIASRLPQVISGYWTKSTGATSFVTFFLNFVGCLARVFTIATETQDINMIVGSINFRLCMLYRLCWTWWLRFRSFIMELDPPRKIL